MRAPESGKEREGGAGSAATTAAWSALRDPMAWTGASKCLFVAVAFLTPTLWYWADWSYVRLHPDSAPYMDVGFLPTALRVQTLTISAWALVAIASLAARSRSRTPPGLIFGTLALAVWEILYGSYFFGHITSLFAGLVVITCLAIGFVLFEKSAMNAAAGAILLGLIGLGVMEGLGLIPYAPLFREAPYRSGELHSSWLFNTGGVTALLFLFCATIIYLVIDRWHDRESALAEARSQLAKANGVIRRYIPEQLAERILSGAHAADGRPERRKLTLFFSDVVGFTQAADQMEPEDLASLLNEYLSEMSSIAAGFGATVNQFVGDGIMMFFGAPEATCDQDHAMRAVEMSLAMQTRMSELGEKWFSEGIETPFRIRVGINTGVASVGDFGSEGRKTYSAIGNQTNLTARIQDHCAPGRVLISHTTWALVRDRVSCEPRGEIAVKGLHYPVRVYEVDAPA